MTVQPPSRQGCHKVTFGTCDPEDLYQQWQKFQPQGSTGNVWMNTATSAAISPEGHVGEEVLACNGDSNHHIWESGF